MTGSTVAPGYEFTEDQNVIIGHLASRMKVVGRALIILAVLAAAESLVLAWKGSGSVVGLEVGIVLGLIGLWSIRAGAAFRSVTTTQGADISHLMRAIGDIRKLYDLQFWVFVGLAVLIAITLLAMMMGSGRVAGPYP